MKIKWNGHASFTIRTDSGVTIITDPYEPGAFGGQIAYGPISDQADIVLVSHDHRDHNFVEGMKGKPVVVRDSRELKGITIKTMATYHDAEHGAKRGKNTVFVMEADGIRLAFLGDLGHILDQRQLQELGKVDIMCIPVGGYFTIDAGQAEKLVEAVKPKLVLPMHYKTEKTSLPITTVDDFLSRFTKVKKLDASEFEISKQSLPATCEIWALHYAC
jgi:L-ascorbate metabolism protein UlaG (beta-lactamase superfamily)